MHFEYYVFYLWHAHLILKTLSDRVFSFAKVQSARLDTPSCIKELLLL